MGANAQYRFYTPGTLEPELIRDLLGLVSVDVSLEIVQKWSRNELIVAADYALREHLRASDNNSVNRRDKPWFIGMAASLYAVPRIVPDPDQPGYNVGISAIHPGDSPVHIPPYATNVQINDHIELLTPGCSARYGMGEFRVVYGTEHLTFLSDELDRHNITQIEMANYAGMCSAPYRVTARGRRSSEVPWLYLHSNGTVCSHSFRPAESHMFGEWEPS